VAPPIRALLVASALALPAAGVAVVPLLVAVGKQILQDMVFNGVKGQLIGSLAGMGCKGARLASLVATNAERFRPGGGLGGMAGAGGPPGSVAPHVAGGPGMAGGGLPPGTAMPNMPAGMPGGALPPGASVPNMPNVPGAAGLPGVGMPGSAVPGAAMPGGAVAAGAVPGGGMALGGPGGGKPFGVAGAMPASGRMDIPTMAPGSANDMSQVFAAMQARTGSTMTPEQMARAQEALRSTQRAMEHPLTRPETLAVFDELKSLGVLTDSMHSEARDCILLAPQGSDQALGQTGAVFKEVLLPQLRETKAKLASLTPEQQDELAQGIGDALREAKPADRQAFREGLGLGFFPKAVVEKVEAAGR
jgi:hypothetical protein